MEEGHKPLGEAQPFRPEKGVAQCSELTFHKPRDLIEQKRADQNKKSKRPKYLAIQLITVIWLFHSPLGCAVLFVYGLFVFASAICSPDTERSQLTTGSWQLLSTQNRKPLLTQKKKNENHWDLVLV